MSELHRAVDFFRMVANGKENLLPLSEANKLFASIREHHGDVVVVFNNVLTPTFDELEQRLTTTVALGSYRENAVQFAASLEYASLSNPPETYDIPQKRPSKI